ncbi:MAG: hypothetical protein AVDCRST_MAG93-3206, partial [uncultured Chloroflexia bacterium]
IRSTRPTGAPRPSVAPSATPYARPPSFSPLDLSAARSARLGTRAGD